MRFYHQRREDLHELITKAVILGSMEGRVAWLPTKVISLEKRIGYHADAIKATPFPNKRMELLERIREYRKELRYLDPECCKTFITKLTVFPESSSHPQGIPVHFKVDFSGDLKVEWKVEEQTHNLFRGASQRINSKESNKANIFFILPSLIPNNVIYSRDDLEPTRYEFHPSKN